MASKKEKHALLKHIAESTADQSKKFAVVKHDDEHVKQLVAEGLIQLDPNGPGADGNIAAIAVNPAAGASPATDAAPAPAPASEYKLEQVYLKPLPAKTLAKTSDPYPFFTMEVGQSFVVPVSAQNPDPVKKMIHKVGGVIRSMSVVDPTGRTKINRKKEAVPLRVATKLFTVRAVTKGETYPDGYVEQETGARIYRTK